MTVRKDGVVLSKFFAQSMERFFWLTIARDQPECPISNLLFAGVPFVSPGKENGASESTFDDAIDVPAQHFGLLILAVPDRIHSEFAKDERTIFDEILQTKEITLEIALLMQINVEAKKIDVLREQEFSRRISGVGELNARIEAAAHRNEMLDKLCDASHAQPADH